MSLLRDCVIYREIQNFPAEVYTDNAIVSKFILYNQGVMARQEEKFNQLTPEEQANTRAHNITLTIDEQKAVMGNVLSDVNENQKKMFLQVLVNFPRFLSTYNGVFFKQKIDNFKNTGFFSGYEKKMEALENLINFRGLESLLNNPEELKNKTVEVLKNQGEAVKKLMNKDKGLKNSDKSSDKQVLEYASFFTNLYPGNGREVEESEIKVLKKVLKKALSLENERISKANKLNAVFSRMGAENLVVEPEPERTEALRARMESYYFPNQNGR